MKSFGKLLDIIDRFYSLATDETDPDFDPKQEKPSSVSMNWAKKIMELGKTNPNDPRFVKLQRARKEHADTMRMLRQEDPEIREFLRSQERERQRRYMERLDADKRKEYLANKRQQEAANKKELLRSNSIKGLCKKLSVQLNDKKSGYKKRDKHEQLQEIEKLFPAIIKFRDLCLKINDPSDKESIITAIHAGDPALSAAKTFSGTIARTVRQLILTIQNMADDYTQS